MLLGQQPQRAPAAPGCSGLLWVGEQAQNRQEGANVGHLTRCCKQAQDLQTQQLAAAAGAQYSPEGLEGSELGKPWKALKRLLISSISVMSETVCSSRFCTTEAFDMNSNRAFITSDQVAGKRRGQHSMDWQGSSRVFRLRTVK